MGASEEAYGAGHPATFAKQPASPTQRAQLSEIAHHKDGDANHGFTIETPKLQFDHSRDM